jgi:hypothetical protein
MLNLKHRANPQRLYGLVQASAERRLRESLIRQPTYEHARELGIPHSVAQNCITRFQEQTEEPDDDAEDSQAKKRVGRPASHSEVVRIGRHGEILVMGDEDEDEEEEKEQEEQEEDDEEDEDDDEEPLQLKAKVQSREAGGMETRSCELVGSRIARNWRGIGTPWRFEDYAGDMVLPFGRLGVSVRARWQGGLLRGRH